jgi:cysteine-rich repeat protein
MRSASSRLSISILGLTALFAAACSNDPKTEGEGGSETAGTTGIASLGDGDGAPGDGDGTPGDGDGTPGDGDGTPGDGDGASGECGNGVIEAGEICDDGNTQSGDGCSATCNPEGPIPCEGQIYECGDTIDNDGDGKVDLEDTECISPCDDDESTFRTSLPGQNNDCKGDCYFDANSGSGDDKCEWNLICDPANPGAEIGCAYDPNYMMCDTQMPQDCLDFCVPLIPNGCDCFGCCQIDGEFVYLDGAGCSLDNLGGCTSCTFFENCGNPCMPELCELCFGQDPSDLPPECNEPACPDGLQSCLDSTECEEGLWCQTGCCVPIALP